MARRPAAGRWSRNASTTRYHGVFAHLAACCGRFSGPGPTGKTTDCGHEWSWEYLSAMAPACASVYPNPFVSGDLDIVIGTGNLRTRVSGEWEAITGPDMTPTFGIVRPRWDGTLWIAGRSIFNDKIRVYRRIGNGWTLWTQGLPEVPVPEEGSDFHFARLWACPVTGDVFLKLPGGGLWMYSRPASWTPEAISAGPVRSRVHPNPSYGRVQLSLGGLPRATYDVVVFDVVGRRVGFAYRGQMEGQQTVTWDGRDDRGRRATPGPYLLRIAGDSGRLRLAEKVLLLSR